MTYEPPSPYAEYYTCPHCHTLTKQLHDWLYIERWDFKSSQKKQMVLNDLRLHVCSRCKGQCIWFKDILLYPVASDYPHPSPDLPAHIRPDVQEARSISGLSPRGASALIRVALEKLCIHLGADGKDLDKKIGWLVVHRRLDPLVQQTLDIVRVVGNDAVHPGQLDDKADVTDVHTMFRMLNEIVEELITKPARVHASYNSLPEGRRKAIEERNEKERTRSEGSNP